MGRNISFANSSKCSNGLGPPSSVTMSCAECKYYGCLVIPVAMPLTFLFIFSPFNVIGRSFTNSRTLPFPSFEGITLSNFIVSGTTKHLQSSSSQNRCTHSLRSEAKIRTLYSMRNTVVIYLTSSVASNLSNFGPTSLGNAEVMRSLIYANLGSAHSFSASVSAIAAR